MLEQFHFLEPLWLFALIPLILIFWLAFQASTDSRSWEKIIDANLLPLLLSGEDKNNHKLPKFLLGIAWFVTVIALADPVWEKIPRPIFQTNAARVLVFDMSNSMLIDDVKPSRLERARFKIEDILSREEEGQSALVLFAGEAFTASPLTRDTETIRSLLKVLTPQIMPAQGSRADLGLVKAHELLKQGGIVNGQVLLIADGVSEKALSLKAAENLRSDGHRVSVMGVGTEAGGKLNFRNNTSVSVKLEEESLRNIANSGGGEYHLMTSNNTDLKRLLTSITDNSSLEEKSSSDDNDMQNSEWHSTGPLLILILLPFAALAFRRGWLFNIVIACSVLSFITQPQTVLAAENELETKLQNPNSNMWKDFVEKLTKNKAQRANDALKNHEYEKARELSKDPVSKGSAEYKLEDYEQALDNFKQAEGSDARYNEANTLAKLEKYEEAIAAYDEALKLEPTMEDAIYNKKAIQDFLKQQQNSGKDNNSSNENQQGNSDSQSDNQDQQSGDSEQNQDNQEASQSAEKGGEQESEDGKQERNQFSDANEELEKNKKDGEEEETETAQNENNEDENAQMSEGQDKNDESKDPQEEGEGAEGKLAKLSPKEKDIADELNKEEKMAAEQWLRRIPDDPGGLLRRKFKYQYNQNRRNTHSTEQPW